jgi:hypothetical protein
MTWYLHACPVCGGDLHDDLEDRGWATCFLCARSFHLGTTPSLAGRVAGRESEGVWAPEDVVVSRSLVRVGPPTRRIRPLDDLVVA